METICETFHKAHSNKFCGFNLWFTCGNMNIDLETRVNLIDGVFCHSVICESNSIMSLWRAFNMRMATVAAVFHGK